MGVVKRDGKWRLEKIENGVYLVTKRGNEHAKIITDDYEPDGMMDDHRNDLAMEIVEVHDFQEAKEVFGDFAEGNSRSGIF